MAFEMRLAIALEDAVGIGVDVDAGGLDEDADVGFEGGGVLETGGALEEGVGGEIGGVELGVAAGDALHVEDVVDELDEPVGVADGDFEHVRYFVGAGLEGAAGDEAEGGAEAGERRAQLVRDGGDELVLHLVEGAALGGVGEGDDDADGLARGRRARGFRFAGARRSRRGRRCRPCARRFRWRRGRCRRGLRGWRGGRLFRGC